MENCKHCDDCNKTPVSFWELCDSGTCIPDALLMTPPVCWSCWDNCEHKLMYITLDGLKAQLWYTDFLVKAHPNDPCAWTLAEKLDLSDDCLEWTLDQTNSTCPWWWWKWKLRLKDNCVKTSLIALTDGPWTYANCNVIVDEDGNASDCWCELTSCPSWVLVSKCDGSGWERQCPNSSCVNNTNETNYNWHSKNVQIFWYSSNNNWVAGPQFLCPKKKFIAKVKWNSLQVSQQFDNNIITYSAPDAYAASVITNMKENVYQYDSWIDSDIWWTDITVTNNYIVAIKIPHSNRYEIWQSWSCLTNRWVHTIRHQIMKFTWNLVNPVPLLDFRMEWTIFKKQNISDDNFIWVDLITDLNSFSDMTNDLTVSWDSPEELKMDAWLWRTLRWHWFWQTTVEWLEKDDILFFIYKVQTFPVWEENWCTFWQIAYVWDWTAWTNWAWAWLQWFVRELDEYWARMESDSQVFTAV